MLFGVLRAPRWLLRGLFSDAVRVQVRVLLWVLVSAGQGVGKDAAWHAGQGADLGSVVAVMVS